MKVVVTRAGFLSTVQDLGRIGFRRDGVGLSGALDPHALRVANSLAGNEPSVAGIEMSLGAMRLRFEDDRVVAWCGGDFDVFIAGVELRAGRVGFVSRGDELSITASEEGGYAWLAISGGIDVPEVLGSRATDLRAKFGGQEGAALRDGQELALGPMSDEARRIAARLQQASVGHWSPPRTWSNTAKQAGWLRFVRGAEWDLFTPGAQVDFVRDEFEATQESDRMGVRLKGALLRRLANDELLSEAVVPGTIQVPPSGQPILLLGDCQTIGGYPKIAHVITVDLPLAAQLRPGNPVRFVEVSLAEAHRLLVERERNFNRFQIGLRLQNR